MNGQCAKHNVSATLQDIRQKNKQLKRSPYLGSHKTLVGYCEWNFLKAHVQHNNAFQKHTTSGRTTKLACHIWQIKGEG